MGSRWSKTIWAWPPRKAKPITSLPCSSRQARTQRVHWMQADRFTVMAGWLVSAGTAGRGAKRLWDTPRSSHQWSSSLSWRKGAWPSGVGGTSARSNSSTRRWARCTRGVAVCTTMPDCTVRQHEALKVRSPCTSTTQARQLPWTRRPCSPWSGAWHRWGMVVPCPRAACHSVWPSSAVTVLPSISSCRVLSSRGAFMARPPAPHGGSGDERCPWGWGRPGRVRRSRPRASRRRARP